VATYPEVYVLLSETSMESPRVRGVFATWSEADRRMRYLLHSFMDLKKQTQYSWEMHTIYDRLDNDGRPCRGYIIDTGERIHASMTCRIQKWEVEPGQALEMLAEQSK